MPSSLSGTWSRDTSTPAPSPAISASDDASPAAPQSCSEATKPPLNELERCLDQLLAGERIADLERRPLLVGAFCELLAGEHRCAADTVSAGGGAVENNEVPMPLARARVRRSTGRRPTHIALTRQLCSYASSKTASRQRSAPRRYCRTADPRDGAAERPVRRAEPQAVEQRDRPGTHRDDVAQDPADPGRAPWNGSTALGWLWLSTLNAIPSPSPTSITPAFFTGPCRTRSPDEGKPLEELRRMFVATVLGPKQRKDRELEVIWLPAEQVADPVKLAVRQPKGAMKRLFRYGVRELSLAASTGRVARGLQVL